MALSRSMKNSHHKIWGIGNITLAVCAFALVAGRSITRSDDPTALALVGFACVAVLSAYRLAFSLIMSFNFRVFSATRFRRLITVIIVASIAAGLIHYARFIPSDHATTVISKTIATMFLVAGMSTACLLLHLLWASPHLRSCPKRRPAGTRRLKSAKMCEESGTYSNQRSLRRSRNG